MIFCGRLLEISLKVDIWMTASVMLLNKYVTDKQFLALIALEVVCFLLFWKFQKVLISRQRPLFDLQLFA